MRSGVWREQGEQVVAFQLQVLLSHVDVPAPSPEEVLSCLASGVGFALEGSEGERAGTFHTEVNGDLFSVEVVGLGDSDQHVLTNTTKDNAKIRFVTDYGDVYHYAAFCRVDRRLAEQALRHFLVTGQRDSGLYWVSVSDMLQNGHVEFG